MWKYSIEFHGFLSDRAAVDQLPGRDQHAFIEDRVLRRDQQIALRQRLAERARFDADGQDLLWVRMACAVHAPAADPDDAPQLAARDQDDIACFQIFNRPLALRRRHAGAAREADRGDDEFAGRGSGGKVEYAADVYDGYRFNHSSAVEHV